MELVYRRIQRKDIVAADAICYCFKEEWKGQDQVRLLYILIFDSLVTHRESNKTSMAKRMDKTQSYSIVYIRFAAYRYYYF